MLTKSQRRRSNQRYRKEVERRFREEMGPAPELPADLEDALKKHGNLDKPLDDEPWEKAPPHMVDYDECPGLNEGALKKLSKAGNDARVDMRDDQIGDLKKRYPSKWGKRSGAKYISEREGVPERTLQRWFHR
jgi:hypothetical protein